MYQVCFVSFKNLRAVRQFQPPPPLCGVVGRSTDNTSKSVYRIPQNPKKLARTLRFLEFGSSCPSP